MTRSEVESFVEETLVGFTVLSVKYLIPESMDPESLGHFVGFDQAEAGVALVGDSREVQLRWSQDGFTESLWVGPPTNDTTLWSPHTREVAVVGGWEGLIGFPIEEVVHRWLPLAEEVEAIWAIRLRVGGRAVSVALGEVDYESGSPSYVPDCVLAIFDEPTGRAYHPWEGVTSAWGESRA